MLANYFIDPIYVNATDGFDVSSAGASSPHGITFDTTDNSFWIVDSTDDSVYHFNSSGDNQTDGFNIGSAGASGPRGITTNDSDFWVAEGGDDFVYHFNSSGDNQTDGFDVSSAGASNPYGIAFDLRDNSFWMSDFTDDFVYHFNSSGDNQTDGFDVLSAGVSFPIGITFDSTDNSFWIVDGTNDFVYHFNSSGDNQTDGFDVSGAGVSGPRGIAFDPTDNSFWITDNGDDFVYHFIPITEGARTEEENFTHLEIGEIHPYNNLVLYMPFDFNHSDSGNTTFDYTINDNDGTVIGAIFNTTDCLYGNCLSLDGINDFVDLGVPSSELQTNNMTIMAWVNFNAINSRQGIIQDGDDDSDMMLSNEGYFLEITSNNNISFSVNDDMSTLTSITSDVNITANNWRHVAARIDSDPGATTITITVFVDGNNQSVTASSIAEVSYGNAGLTFGSILDDGTRINYMNGLIDEVMIFNHSLTNAEIKDIYNNQSSRFKIEGIKEFLSFNVSLTNEDRVNVSAGIQRFFQTNVSLDLGLWNISLGYNDSIDGDSSTVAIDDGIIGWWHFENQSDQGENDTFVFDWSGNNNNGTWNGSLTGGF